MARKYVPGETSAFVKEAAPIAGGIVTFAYYFYAVLALLGVVAYFLKWQPLLYLITGTCIVIYIVQLMIGFKRFWQVLLLAPVASVLIFMLFDNSFSGICLGILLAFIIRHMVKRIVVAIWVFVIKLIEKTGILG